MQGKLRRRAPQHVPIWKNSMLALMVGTMLVTGISLPLSLHWILRHSGGVVPHNSHREHHENVAIAKPLPGGVPVRTKRLGGNSDEVQHETVAVPQASSILEENGEPNLDAILDASKTKMNEVKRRTTKMKFGDGAAVHTKSTSDKHSHSEKQLDVREHVRVVPVQLNHEQLENTANQVTRQEGDTVVEIPYKASQKRREDWNYIHDVNNNQARLEELTKEAGKVYCAIPSMYTERKLRMWSAILQTYGGRCDVLKFFVDPLENHKVPPAQFIDESGVVADIVVLPIVRSGGNCWTGGMKTNSGEDKRTPCKHIWEKVWRMWVWVYENDLDAADWFVKVDDDTFMFPENLKLFVLKKKWKGTEPHYFGHRLVHAINRPLIAGGAAVMSQGALQKVAPVYMDMEHEYGDRKNFKHGRCVDRDGATEEVTTSICLHSVGITAEPSSDEQGREKVMTFPVIDHFLMIRRPDSTGWYWKNKDPINRGGEFCCDPKAFAFHHHKRPGYLLRLNELIYSSSNELENLLETYDTSIPGKDGSLVQSSSRYERDVVMMQIKYFWSVRQALIKLEV